MTTPSTLPQDSVITPRLNAGQRFARWRRQRRTHALVRALERLDGRPEIGTSEAADDAVARTVERLLRAGADPNGRFRRTLGDDRWSERPALMMALRRTWAMDDAWWEENAPGAGLRVLRALLDAGADPESASTHHGVPLTDAPSSGRMGHRMVLGSTRSGMSASFTRPVPPADLPLHHAVDGDLTMAVIALLRAGARPDRLDQGLTVWDRVRSVDVAQALLDGGADPLQVNGEGLTRLDQERQAVQPSMAMDLMAWLERQALQRTMRELIDDGKEAPLAARTRARL